MARRRFEFLLAGGLAVTLGIKVFVVGGIEDPKYAEVVATLQPFFETQGYQVTTGPFVASRDTVLATRNECLMYIVPISHTGWHETTLRKYIGDQRLWFAFAGKITEGNQERLRPLVTYYLSKAARYVGFDAGYPPMLGLTTSGTCDFGTIDWAKVPTVPFRTLSLGGDSEP